MADQLMGEKWKKLAGVQTPLSIQLQSAHPEKRKRKDNGRDSKLSHYIS